MPASPSPAIALGRHRAAAEYAAAATPLLTIHRKRSTAHDRVDNTGRHVAAG